ncbi:uncharacterized protein [Rutidosis leptorrhynchoides]|uniref:uncharacterized protein n=1 Tax=Rutidosis leptorrhynchoides TaxID=125765 RepID=UPI003A990FB9
MLDGERQHLRLNDWCHLMSDIPPVIILDSDSDSSATSTTDATDTQIPLTSDPGASSSGTSSHTPVPVVTAVGAQDPPEIPAPVAPVPQEPQPRPGGVVIPAEFGEGPFRNHLRMWCRRAPDGRLVPIPPGRYRQMMAARGQPVQPPVQPPPADSSSDGSSTDDTSDDDSDEEDLDDAPVLPPSTPPKKRYRFDGTVIPGINGGRAFTDAHGQRCRVTDPCLTRLIRSCTLWKIVMLMPMKPKLKPSVVDLAEEYDLLVYKRFDFRKSNKAELITLDTASSVCEKEMLIDEAITMSNRLPEELQKLPELQINCDYECLDLNNKTHIWGVRQDKRSKKKIVSKG